MTTNPFIFIFVLLFLSSAFGGSEVFAQTNAPLTEYKLLEPLPGITSDSAGTKTNANTYIAGLFNLTLALAVVFAVLRLIYAGITYMSSDAFGKKGAAKAIIEQTLWGLALAISAWVIVATVLPPTKTGEFIFDLSLESIPLPKDNNPPLPPGTGGGGGVRPGYTLTPQQVQLDQSLRTLLENNSPSITVNNPPCISGGTRGCTNVVGLPQHAIGGLKLLASTCKCTLEITGGTEGGHITHGPNIGAVDLFPTAALNSYLGVPNPTNGTRITKGGATYTYETTGANGRATGNHWHVRF